MRRGDGGRGSAATVWEVAVRSLWVKVDSGACEGRRGWSKRCHVLRVGGASGPFQASQGRGRHLGGEGVMGVGLGAAAGRKDAGSTAMTRVNRAFAPQRILLGSQLVTWEEDDGKGDTVVVEREGVEPPNASGAGPCEDERSRDRRKRVTVHR